MIGLWVVLAALLAALAFGGYRQLSDGRARPLQADDRDGVPRLDASHLGSALGREATFVQFSSEFCAPCRATERLLTRLVSESPGVQHIELDAAVRLDLVKRFDVTRTPTVLLLDREGFVRHRIVGAPRTEDVTQALTVLSAD